MKKAVILLSGGLDSATVAVMAKDQGYQLYGLTISYGQRHECEIQAAQNISKKLGFLQHQILEVPLNHWGGSALVASAGENSKIPLDRTTKEIGQGVPPTYVPARNTVLLSLALAWAEVLKADAIFLGVNVLDYSGYPDCRPEFMKAFENLARLATKAGVEKGYYPALKTPLIQLTKAQIIQKGMKLGLDYGLTHSCYRPDQKGVACGRCDSCQLRLKGFAQAGLKDPIPYQTSTNPSPERGIPNLGKTG